MKDLLIKILEALGFEGDVITTIQSGDEKKIAELKAEEIVTEAIDRQKEILAGDEDFTKPIADQATVSAISARERNFLKEFKSLITQEEFDKLPKDKRLDAAFGLLARKVKEKAPTDDEGKKAVQELQAEVDRLNAEVDKLSSEKEEAVNSIKSEYETKISSAERERILKSELIKTLGGKLIQEDDDTYELILKKAERLYDIKIEEGKVVLYEKGKATKATKSSKPITIDSVFLEVSEGWQKKQDPAQPKKHVTERMKDGDDEGTTKKFQPGSDVFQAELAKRKEAAGK